MWKPARFKDTTMTVPTPKCTSWHINELTIHHVEEARTIHQCKRCPACFRRRNKLFAHLRTPNQYMPVEVFSNHIDPTAEFDPEVVKSAAPQTFGTGYGFRTFNHLEMPVRLSKHSDDTWVCLDTGAGMSLVDRQWLTENCPDAMILTRTSSVSVRGIDNRTQKTSSYVVLQLFVPGYDTTDNRIKLAEIRREFNIVGDLRSKMIVGEDFLEPEGIVIDSQARKASVKWCSNFAFKVQITEKGRQILHRRVSTQGRVSVAPGARAPVPIKCKPLPADRDCEFTPVYEMHTNDLAEAGGFLRAVIDNRTECVVFHNRSEHTVVVQKGLRIGYVTDFTLQSYHACAAFDPEEHPALFDAALSGTWIDRRCPDIEKNGKLDNDVCAMEHPWEHDSRDYCEVHIAENAASRPADNVNLNSTDVINESQVQQLRNVVSRFATIFEDRGTVTRETDEEHMRITLKPGVQLPNKGPYNNSTKHRAVMDTTFDKHHGDGKMGWLEPERACVASPAFVVWQSLKGRVVMDIHGLNAAVWKDPYPMPHQEDILQALKGCHWLTTLDLTAAFMQRALRKDSQHLVTVVTHRGLEYFKVAPFGFTNSSAHMQRFMDGRMRRMRAWRHRPVRYSNLELHQVTPCEPRTSHFTSFPNPRTQSEPTPASSQSQSSRWRQPNRDSISASGNAVSSSTATRR
jgi:hypothetical protein